MAEPIRIEGFLDFLKISGKYYYMHDLELRSLIDAGGVDTTYGAYEENVFLTFKENTFYEKEGNQYVLLDSQPEDWETKYSKYYFLNKTGISSNRESLSTSYVIFNALSQKLDITTFEQFEEVYTEFVEYIQEHLDDELTEKVDKTTYEAFLNEFYTFVESLADVAYSASFNDLVDTPNGLGAHVEGTDLVFTGPAYGGMTAQEDENLAELIGSGIVP